MTDLATLSAVQIAEQLERISAEARLTTKEREQLAEAARRVMVGENWRTIDSAPRDGTVILLALRRRVERARMGSPRGAHHGPSTVWCGYWWEGGWRLEGKEITADATHWQPVPVSPLYSAEELQREMAMQRQFRDDMTDLRRRRSEEKP